MNGLKRLLNYARETKLDLGIKNRVRDTGDPSKFAVYSSDWENGEGDSIDEACEDFIKKMVSKHEAIVTGIAGRLKNARKNLAKAKRI